MDENGLLQTDLVKIKGRWKRYIEQLYVDNEKPDISPLEEEHEVLIDALGPPFIYSESLYRKRSIWFHGWKRNKRCHCIVAHHIGKSY